MSLNERSEYFDLSKEGRITFKKGIHKGDALDETRLNTGFGPYMLYLKLRTDNPVDEKICEAARADKGEREIWDEYLQEEVQGQSE